MLELIRFNAEGAENAEVRRGDLNTFLCGSQRPLRLCVKKIRAPCAQIERLQCKEPMRTILGRGVVDAAIAADRELGPGLLETACDVVLLDAPKTRIPCRATSAGCHP